MAVDDCPPELLPPEARGVVFDCDGTLVDTMAYHFVAWKHTCDVFGLHLTAAMIVELAGKPVNELFDIVCERSGKAGQVDRDAFFRIKEQYYKDNHKPATLIEPVMRIVRAAKARGLPMAVASGGQRKNVISHLTETGILDWFGDAIVCGEDVQRGKPFPDGFLLAAQKIGVDPKHCVGYEDAKLGMEAIQAAGYLKAVDVTLLEGYPHLV